MVRVTAWKTVDVEVEVDVDIAEVFAELKYGVNVCDGKYWRAVAPVLENCVLLLGMVGDEVIAQLPAAARANIRERLTKEAARYQEPA